MTKLLLLSNSTNPGEPYLNYPKHNIKAFLGDKPVKAVFIPYAAVTFSYDEYENKVNNRFEEIGHSVVGIHHFDNPKQAIQDAEAIVIGGGNTWKLVRTMRDHGLIDLIREKVKNGVPYIGWSAGSNVACPTLRTTNDMPIIDPLGFDTINLVPFQINPHYTDAHPEGHGGETREMRINEFIIQNPDAYVVGLREGTMLWVDENDSKKPIQLIGNKTTRIFKNGQEPYELNNKDDFNFLMK